MRAGRKTVTSLNAVEYVRAMRGRSQSQLLLGDDGYRYVVKFQNNPRGTRTLVNEWIANRFLQHIGIRTPETCTINITDSFLKRNPAVYLGSNESPVLIAPGRHFASRHVDQKSRTPVYDMMPDTMMWRVHNASEICGARVLNAWVANKDQPQLIYTADESALVTCPTTGSQKQALNAHVISSGNAFGGIDWRLPCHPAKRSRAYMPDPGKCDTDAIWIRRIQAFPPPLISEIMRSTPEDWLGPDERDLLCRLTSELIARRDRLAGLIRAAVLSNLGRLSVDLTRIAPASQTSLQTSHHDSHVVA